MTQGKGPNTNFPQGNKRSHNRLQDIQAYSALLNSSNHPRFSTTTWPEPIYIALCFSPHQLSLYNQSKLQECTGHGA